MLLLIWLRPRYKIPEFFTIAPVLISTLMFATEIVAIRHLYMGCVTSITKNSRSGLDWSRPRADRGLSWPTSVFRTTIGVCKRSVEIWPYEGQQPLLE